MRQGFLKTTAAALSALTVLPLAGCGSSSAGGDEPILIGMVAGTTGAYGTIGKAMVNGAEMAIEDLNAEGGLLGRNVALKWHNDNASATLAAQHFDRLVSEGAVAVAGSNDTGPAVAAHAERRRIPAIGVVDDGGLTVYPDGPGTEPYEWTFSTGLNAFAWGRKIAEYAVENCDELALLHDPTAYGKAGELAIEAVYKEAGESLVLNQPITENWSTGATVGLTAEVNKIMATGADCVDVWLTPQNQAAFAKAAHDLGAEFTILGNDVSNSDDTFVSLGKEHADGVITAALTARLEPDDRLKAFQQEYEQKHGIDSSPFAEANYDGIMMLAQVIRDAESTEPEALRKGLNKITDFPGLTGTLTFTPEKHTTIEADQISIVAYDAEAKQWKPLS